MPIYPLRPVAALCLCTLLLPACSSQPKAPPAAEQAQKLQAAMDSGGYAPAGAQVTAEITETWDHDGQQIDIAMIAPTQPGRYPLLIYLPSLGEDATAGKLWRETWAKAGYAVFSLQPRNIGQALSELRTQKPAGADAPPPDEIADDDSDEDTDKKGDRPSRSARSSELRYLGHEFFAVDALKLRMQQLYWTYRQLRSRIETAQAPFAGADLSRVVLAGYDLGAQTVTAVLGENFSTPLPENRDIHPLAAIVLSPSIDLAEGNVRSRFQNLDLPMLVVTGSDDNDPYAISSGSARAAAWEFSPSGGKYLLQLSGDVHGLLAGSDMGGRLNARQRQKEDGGGGWFGGGRGNFTGNAANPANPGNGGQGPFANGYFGQGNQPAAAGPADSSLQYGGGSGHGHGGGRQGGPGMGGDGEEGKTGRELGYKQVAAVFSASCAFLDQIVKGDDFAQFWLNDKANTWLDRAGVMKVR